MIVTAGGMTAAAVLTSGGAGADPASADWAKLRACESSDRYDVVADNGHYGAYQFGLSTWAAVGGTGLPSNASRAEQDYRALYLYRMRGWQPWSCAPKTGLTDDRDAASRRVPTRGDAAYIDGPSSAAHPWPGAVYRPGDCADALRVWQLRMKGLGFAFRGTGCYGALTAQAVTALQRANGLTTSGLLGPRTWAAAWTGKAPHVG